MEFISETLQCCKRCNKPGAVFFYEINNQWGEVHFIACVECNSLGRAKYGTASMLKRFKRGIEPIASAELLGKFDRVITRLSGSTEQQSFPTLREFLW